MKIDLVRILPPKIRGRCRDWAVWTHLKMLHILNRNHPIPLRHWLLARRLLRSLVPPTASRRTPGGALADRNLSELLQNDTLGEWALDADTITFLWGELRAQKPSTILECGSGLSTVVLARYAAWLDSAHGLPARVVSLEQNLEVKQQTHNRLAASELDSYVRILHAPLTEDSRYRVDRQEMERSLEGREADWLLVDGPSGPTGCRVFTLFDLGPYCRVGARWFLDDAFRDGELHVLKTWADSSITHVEGIVPIGKGFATGVLRAAPGVQ